ncbi:hypothetical protein CANTEDRAFT_113346 [Yamadazyma tenuis ATCC 10573]|uniref:Uncharacterized protein n=2 Tax=Candida tenuis TaxID=2315449 RepID=G3B211_CANTC|nr:uncharacterized protein CANTEDRAFT_113346 [Yamadazyma tenuis ATCC 10573]EGV64579.1 hypothetical protein CANTEDRAFT_113346 [Yamadazyma tenuis ATCC 10573]
MVLQSVTSSPARPSSLKPSPPLNNKGSAHHANKTGSATGTHQQTTPTLPKKQLNVNTATNPLLTTPTQPSQKSNGNHDDEGADLLMYLATSPSPAKSYFPNAPKLGAKQPAKQPPSQPQSQSQAPVASQSGDPLGSSAPNSSGGAFSIHKHTSSNSSANSFIAPPPPLTPKRHINTTMNSKTPQNRLTPSVNLFNNMVNNGSSGLPSSGLALTPAGFNMNDYVNFFSPSPGGAHLSKNFLKTPDFNNLLAANANSSQAQSKVVDGKMINFDKVGLFKNTESRD